MKKTVFTILTLLFSISFCHAQNIREAMDEQKRREEQQAIEAQKHREAQQSRALEQQYENYIISAQKNYNNRNYSQAKIDYLNALEVKPQNAAVINDRIYEIEKRITEKEIIIIEEENDETHIFENVDEMPEFPGGEEALIMYIKSSIRYPAIARENGISGRVFVQFIIEPTGEVSNAKVTKGVDPSLDREAIRVVQAMPKWKPGKQRNQPVRVLYAAPIIFNLQN